MEPTTWVQPILVRLADSHFDAIRAVAVASTQANRQHLDSLDPDGFNAWGYWLSDSVTKTVRRVKRFPDLGPYVEFTVGDTTARAFAPVRYAHLPKSIAKAQVSGTDIADHHWPEPMPIADVVIRSDLDMTTGKAAAQAAHAANLSKVRPDHIAFVGVDSSTFFRLQRHAMAMVKDAGRTEIDPGTITALVLR